MKDKPKTIIVGNGFTGLTEAYVSGDMYKPPVNLTVSTQIKRIIEPHEKPSKMYNDLQCGIFPNVIFVEPETKEEHDARIKAEKQRKKHLATCAKNRRNRKSKKRKNR